MDDFYCYSAECDGECKESQKQLFRLERFLIAPHEFKNETRMLLSQPENCSYIQVYLESDFHYPDLSWSAHWSFFEQLTDKDIQELFKRFRILWDWHIRTLPKPD